MDTSNTDAEAAPTEETPMNGVEEATTDSKASKRKRPSKKPVETEETSISNGRPRRTLPKRKFSLCQRNSSLCNGIFR